MSLNHTSIRTLVIFFTAIVGCTKDDALQDHGPPKSEAIETSRLSPYVGCDESVADHVLLLAVTVPNVLDAALFRVPFRKSERDGTHYGGGGSSFSGTGPDGGINGFIGIESSTDTSLTVRVDLSWSTSQTKGELDELIDIPIGKAGNKELSKDRMIEWRFVTPTPENNH